MTTVELIILPSNYTILSVLTILVNSNTIYSGFRLKKIWNYSSIPLLQYHKPVHQRDAEAAIYSMAQFLSRIRNYFMFSNFEIGKVTFIC